MSRKKRLNKTKEQIAREAKDKSELLEMKDLAGASILKILIEHNRTVFQATNVLEVMKQVALGKMNSTWNDRKFSEIGLAEELTTDEEAKDKDMYGAILETLKDFPVAKVMKMLDVLSRVIDAYANRQILQVRVADLPIDEIMK